MGRSETILLYVICYEGLGVLDQFKIPKIHTMFRTKDKCYRANSLYQKLLLLNSWSTNNSSSKLNQSCRQIHPFNRLKKKKKKIHTLLRTTQRSKATDAVQRYSPLRIPPRGLHLTAVAVNSYSSFSRYFQLRCAPYQAFRLPCTLYNQ